jgi:uncharacterized coiled-coil DUF342 family protein
MTDIVERLLRYFDRREGGEYHCAIVDASAEITSLRLSLKEIREENDRLKGERDESSRAWRDSFDSMHQRAMNAEALIRELVAALDEAIGEYEHNSTYKGKYLQEKHEDAKEIARLRAVLDRAKKMSGVSSG